MSNNCKKNLLAYGCDQSKLFDVKKCDYLSDVHPHGETLCCNSEICGATFDKNKYFCSECKESICDNCYNFTYITSVGYIKICKTCQEKYSCTLCVKYKIRDSALRLYQYISLEERDYCSKCQKIICQTCYSLYDVCPDCYQANRREKNDFL
jgi:hypothetical protein